MTDADLTSVIAEVVTWDADTLVGAVRAARPWLSDDWELTVRVGLEKSPKKTRNELERLVMASLSDADAADEDA